MKAKVSIIIPVYNAEKCIRRCVDSVLTQEFTDFELLLMDDGSRDSTPAILDEYAAKDSRVRVVHKPNSGVSATRNMALGLAEGTYIQFLDADDWITPDATKLFVRTAEEARADMVISDFYRVVGERTARKGDIEADGVITRQEYGEWMMKDPADYYYGVLWNKLFRRDILEAHGLRMDEELRWCEDFIFNMEYVLHTERIAVLHVPLYYYVRTEGSLVQQGLNPAGIVRMKTNVIEYYTEFYRRLYDSDEYERRKPEIERFMIDYAGDDAVIPGLPGTKKLGEERVTVAARDELEPNVFTDHYYTGKLLDRYLKAAALQCGLGLSDIKLLQYLVYSGPQRSVAGAADFAGLSRAQIALSMQKLLAKRLVKMDLDPDELTLNAELTQRSDEVLRRIREAQEDFFRIRYGKHPEEEEKALIEEKRAETARIKKLLF